jgi:hypothetical protein
MPSQICIKAEEVKSESEIDISARIQITSIANLEEIYVKGKCVCEDKPWPLIDLIMLVDGSDSFNNKVTMPSAKGTDEVLEGEAFDETKSWTHYVATSVLGSNLAGRSTFTVIQFSGIKPLEKSYKPGNNGLTGTEGLKHYNIEYETTKFTGDFSSEAKSSLESKLTEYEALDGNGQLFLVLQDLTLPSFTEKLDSHQKKAKDQDRLRVIIIVSDEEWDVKKLANAYEGSGVHSDGDAIAAKVNELYTPMAVIVRPNEFADQNEDFIKNKLCGGKSHNYHKVYTSKFGRGMKRVADTIIDNLKDYR